MLIPIVAVITKELRQTVRDKRMLGMLLMAPILQLTLLGYAVDLDVRDIPTLITDLDRSPDSRAIAQGLSAIDVLKIAGETDDPDGALVRGEAQVAVVIPQGFSADVVAGRPATVQVLIDGSNPLIAQSASNATTLFFQARGIGMLARAGERAAALQGAALRRPSVVAAPRVLYNPQLKSTQAMIPGVAATVLLVITTITTAMGIARERELGTIEQLLVTPIRPATLLLGKTLPFAAIGMVTGGLVLAVGTNLFSVPIRGSLGAVFLSMALYLMTTLSAGVLVSTIARTQQQAILGALFFLLPAILLSGFMSPIENMPRWVQSITYVNPVRHFVAILRAVLLKGATLDDLLEPIGVLAAFGICALGIASMRFRKQLA